MVTSTIVAPTRGHGGAKVVHDFNINFIFFLHVTLLFFLTYWTKLYAALSIRPCGPLSDQNQIGRSFGFGFGWRIRVSLSLHYLYDRS